MMELNKAPKEIFRIFFLNFIFGFFFKAVNSLYCISNLVTPYAPSRALRSSNERFFSGFLWSNFKSKGDGAFTVLGPKLWNSLRSAASIETFKARIIVLSEVVLLSLLVVQSEVLVYSFSYFDLLY